MFTGLEDVEEWLWKVGVLVDKYPKKGGRVDRGITLSAGRESSIQFLKGKMSGVFKT